MTPYASVGVSPAYLVRGLLPHDAIAFAKRADRQSIHRELRAVRVARHLGIGHLVPPVHGWRHPQSGHTYLVSHYLPDAVALNRHPYGAARLRSLAEWEKLALLRWQHTTGDNDRHAENYLVTPDGRVLGIDHGAAYRDAPAGGQLYTRPDQNAMWHRAWRGGEHEAMRRYHGYHGYHNHLAYCLEGDGS